MSESHPHAHLDIERFDALLRRALVFNHIGDAMIVAGPDGAITDWNAGAEELFGWSRAEALGQTPALFHVPEDTPALWSAARATVGRAGRWSGQHAFVRKDGTGGECSAVALPLIDVAGNFWGTLLALTPLGESAAAPEPQAPAARADGHPLASDRLLLHTLIDAVSDPIFFKDLEGRYVLHNAADRALYGHTDLSCIGKTVFDLPGSKEIAALYHANDLAVIQTGEPVVNREEPFVRQDGERAASSHRNFRCATKPDTPSVSSASPATSPR